MKNKDKVQVARKHYFENYDDFNRWISYWWQIKLARGLKKKEILEVGVGNKMVSNYLKKAGFRVTTCDIDPLLKPDHVGDVTRLPFKNESYEVILCFEVLEHLPFVKVKKALKEISRVTKEYAVISVFAANIGTSFIFKIPFFKLIYRNVYVPLFWRRHTFNGEHYWELGKRKYSIERLRNVIRSTGFEIIEEELPPLNIYHHFFVLSKRKMKS